MASYNEIPTHLNIRIDAKLRYITELAARARSMSLTDYIESALNDSFKNVSVDPIEDFDDEPNYRDLTTSELSHLDKIEKLKAGRPVSHPLSEVADNLWSEYPIVRLQLLAGHLTHLMNEDDKAIWDYLFTQPDLYAKDGKLNRKLILTKWNDITKAALAVPTKAKVK